MRKKIIITVFVIIFGVAAIPFVSLTILFISSSIESSRDHKIAEANDSGSGSSSISADGRFIAFTSDDARLPGGDEERVQAFVYDSETGSIVLASTNPQGEAANNGVSVSGLSLAPRISADGSTLVFLAYSSNLIEGAEKGLFSKNLDTGEITPVLIPDDDSRSVFVSSFAVSRDGRFTIYSSPKGVFVHDALVNETKQADIDRLGDDLSDADAGVYGSAISADGRYIAFTLSKKLVKKKNNHDIRIDIYVKDMQTGELRLASVDSAGNSLEYSTHPALSADGSWLVFEYDKTVQLHEVKTKKTDQIANGTYPAISPNGRYIVYQYQEYKDLAPMNCNTLTKCPNIFLFDLETISELRAVVPSDWKSKSGFDYMSVSDNGVITYSADAAFEGIEPEECMFQSQWDETSNLNEVYCKAVYRREPSGQLKRISVPPPE